MRASRSRSPSDGDDTGKHDIHGSGWRRVERMCTGSGDSSPVHHDPERAGEWQHEHDIHDQCEHTDCEGDAGDHECSDEQCGPGVHGVCGDRPDQCGAATRRGLASRQCQLDAGVVEPLPARRRCSYGLQAITLSRSFDRRIAVESESRPSVRGQPLPSNVTAVAARTRQLLPVTPSMRRRRHPRTYASPQQPDSDLSL